MRQINGSGDDDDEYCSKKRRISEKKQEVDENMDKQDKIVIINENGYRHIIPYYFVFKTTCKGRWLGKSIGDVFTKEFLCFPSHVMIKMIETGLTTVNGMKIHSDFVLKDNMMIQTRLHRHEAPIPDFCLKILYEDCDLIVIDKPAGVPIHPVGKYNHNSLLSIIRLRPGCKNIKTVHRLDRLTSGVLMFAKNENKARSVTKELLDGTVEKEYICMVEGIFPENITCNEPIYQCSHSLAFCKCDRILGKPCRTNFTLVKRLENSSIIKCLPETGRMHQIRVHLQFLGFPIKGDPIYSHPTAFGPQRGKGGWTISTESVCEELCKEDSYNTTLTVSDLISKWTDQNRELYEKSIDEFCYDCKNPMKIRDTDHKMHLHAHSYKISDRKYSTELPEWAR